MVALTSPTGFLERPFAVRPANASTTGTKDWVRSGSNDLHQHFLLLKIDGLIVSGLVELCTPHLVNALMLGLAEGHRRPEPNVEVVEIFEGLD